MGKLTSSPSQIPAGKSQETKPWGVSLVLDRNLSVGYPSLSVLSQIGTQGEHRTHYTCMAWPLGLASAPHCGLCPETAGEHSA